MASLATGEGKTTKHHEFILSTFAIPTRCDVCRKILVGIVKQGLKCRLCKTNVHANTCARVALVEIPCNYPEMTPGPLESCHSEAIDSRCGHRFVRNSFRWFTNCRVCNKLLVGAVDQGLKCTECNVPVHFGCAPKAYQSIKCTGEANDDRKLTISDFSQSAFEFESAESSESMVPPPSRSDFQAQLSGNNARNYIQGFDDHSLVESNDYNEKVAYWPPVNSIASLSAHQPSGDFFREFQDLPKDLPIESCNESFDKKLDRWIDSAIYHISDRVDKSEKNLKEGLEGIDRAASVGFEKLDNDGVANTIVKGLRSGTQSVVSAVSSAATIIEQKVETRQNVDVDEKTHKALETVQEGTKVIRDFAEDVSGMVIDATSKGVTRLRKTELIQSLSDSTDPETRAAIVSGLTGVGKVLDETKNSFSEVGRALGSSSVRVSSHLYGEQVGKATEYTVGTVGNILSSYSNVSNIVSLRSLAKESLGSADVWSLREPSVLDGNMYASIFDYVQLDVIVKSTFEAFVEKAEQLPQKVLMSKI